MVKLDSNQINLINLPKIYPKNRCKLRMLKLDRIKDWLLMEEEFLKRLKINRNINQDELKVNLVNKLRGKLISVFLLFSLIANQQFL